MKKKNNIIADAKFIWEVPHVPQDEHVFITASRLQHVPLSYRHRILPFLFHAMTFDELAEQLHALLFNNESKSLPSETWFRTVLLDEKSGRIMHEKIPSFLRRLTGTAHDGQKYIKPSDARYVLDQIFSSLGRSAGGRLAGAPLTTLNTNVYGVESKNVKRMAREIRTTYVYGNRSGENSFSLVKRKITIGQPYVDRLLKAAKVVTQTVDAVSRSLDDYVRKEGDAGKDKLSVEKLSAYALEHLETWLKRKGALMFDGIRSRTHLNMDFYFLPDSVGRKLLIDDLLKNKGCLSDTAKKYLQERTRTGALKLAILDISGGAGTTGLSEFVAALSGHKEAGSINAYINSMMDTYEYMYGKKSHSVVICPRMDDLTLLSTEYIPIVEALKKRGIQSYIVLAEQLEESLEKWNGKDLFKTVTWDGQIIYPELVAKRFTFLGAGVNNTTNRGYIRTELPPGMMIIPSPVSRIPASDKRINSKIIALLQRELEKIGVVVIPTKTIAIVDRNTMESIDQNIEHADEKNIEILKEKKLQYIRRGIQQAIENIITFAQKNLKEWPEIEFLGLILKLDDKRPGRTGKGGELVSAYPIPAGILTAAIQRRTVSATTKPSDWEKQELYLHEIVAHRISDLVEKGVYDIVIQPNVLTVFADGKDFMETKIFVYAKRV